MFRPLANEDQFLGHTFQYWLNSGETYTSIAQGNFSNLTTDVWIQRFNIFSETELPAFGTIDVTINCSCGNREVSKDYGLFVTYPLRNGDSLKSIGNETKLDEGLLQKYNPGVNFSQGSDLVYIPGKDQNGNYVPLPPPSCSRWWGDSWNIRRSSSCTSLISGLYICGILPEKKRGNGKMLSAQDGKDETSGNDEYETFGSGGPAAAGATGITRIRVDKSVEFSYEELANATDNFSMANKIGQGGFGAVYYAELRGEKTFPLQKVAIKKMEMEASREFLAEVKVLTHVHHLNLVRLIGFCVEGSLFVIYEYIDNGNLSQHLRSSGKEPMTWSIRVQIALDSARGLEYIHEHTHPIYIHRDIKSANILIDKNFRGKVADFGLAKLTEVGSSTVLTNKPVGTFGYMPAEYLQFGDVSAKVDVYAFGVVLYELISAKEAIFRSTESAAESKGLVALFDEVLNQPDPTEDLRKVVDPRLGDNYPIDSVLKMAQLAKACTQHDPQRRPSMKFVVVALMTLSSNTENFDVAAFYENPNLVNLMSGR
uniref:non-specific serine/threonine protein kinase n=1 Tax=Cercis chinensis TaxID=161750 RepID=U6EFI5_9FABA|nr:putative LysM domain containing receptor kinase [Cercis chinensis]